MSHFIDTALEALWIIVVWCVIGLTYAEFFLR
jgi:hypothetical protein